MAVLDDQDQLPLDQQGAEPLSPGELATLDQREASLNDSGPSLPAPKSSGVSGKVTGSKKSLQKKILIGTGVGGGLVGLLVIFFLLLLFKNIHIKNLFMDYEFAKFNRAFRNRLEKSIDDPEADPKGTADTTVADGATPEQALVDANAAEIDKIKADLASGDDSSFNGAADSTEQLDLSPAGTAGVTDPELGISTTLPDESGKPDAQVAKDTETQIETAAAGDETSTTAPNQATQDAADETKKALDSGVVDDAQLQDAATKGFSSGLNSAVGKLTGPFVYATFMCIARDIFAIPGHVIQKMQMKGLANESAYVTKTADCQQQGNPDGSCPLSQIGDVAGKFDTTSGGKSQSFTTSCAYLRAAGQVAVPDGANANCTDLSDNLRPSTDIGGIAGTLVQVSNALDGKVTIPVINVGVSLPISQVCGFILNPATQVAAAGLNVFSALAAAIGTGPETFGASDVATAALESAGTIFASKAGAALALDAGLRYSGLDFRRNFSGTMFGNLVGAGTKARADAACAADGCKQLTPTENTQLAMEIHSDLVKEQQTKGLAFRVFSPKNPISTLGVLADKMPSTPQTAMASIGQFFATMLNPVHLGKALMGLINPVKPAWAADTEYETYGLPDYGFTDTELNSIGVVENSRWVNNPANMTQADMSKYDKCFQADLNSILDPPSYCTDSTDTKLEHYRLYKFDQRVTHDLVLLYNNQPGSQTAAANPTNTGTSIIPPGPIQGCVNPFTDPRWGASRIDQGVDYNASAANPLPVVAVCDGIITSTNGPGWAPYNIYINFKFTSGPLSGKCMFVAEHLTNVTPAGSQVIKAGQTIATANGGTEWGWSSGTSTPSDPYHGRGDGTATEGGQAFARFITQLGGPVNDPRFQPNGPVYAGNSCQ